MERTFIQDPLNFMAPLRKNLVLLFPLNTVRSINTNYKTDSELNYFYCIFMYSMFRFLRSCEIKINMKVLGL